MENRDEKGRFKIGHKPEFSEKHRAKISIAKKGKKKTEEHKKKIAMSLTGRTLNNDVKHKMSLAQKGRKITWGDKISVSMKYRKLADERRARMSIDQGGKNIVDSALYKAVHKWIVDQKGKPMICDLCFTKEAKRYEWSNISQQYLFDVSD